MPHPLGGLECTAKKGDVKCTKKINHAGDHHVRGTTTTWSTKPIRPVDNGYMSEGDWQAYGRYGY